MHELNIGDKVEIFDYNATWNGIQGTVQSIDNNLIIICVSTDVYGANSGGLIRTKGGAACFHSRYLRFLSATHGPPRKKLKFRFNGEIIEADI